MKKEHNGFVITASHKSYYLRAASHLIESILDFYPDAKIHLFTEQRFIDELNFNTKFLYKVSTDILSHYRTKIWALNKTDFVKSCYLDADMLCVSSDISGVFDLIGANDIVFTRIREIAAAATWWDHKTQSCPHGGMFAYKNNSTTHDFFDKWLQYYLENYETSPENWNYDKLNPLYTYEKVQIWDQFPLYLMICDKNSHIYNKDIKWDYIDDAKTDWRWNYIKTIYDRKELVGEDKYSYEDAVIEHYPSIFLRGDRISYDNR